MDKDYCSLVAPDEALSRQRTAGFVTLISDGSNCSLRALLPASYMSLGADPQSSETSTFTAALYVVLLSKYTMYRCAYYFACSAFSPGVLEICQSSFSAHLPGSSCEICSTSLSPRPDRHCGPRRERTTDTDRKEQHVR